MNGFNSDLLAQYKDWVFLGFGGVIGYIVNIVAAKQAEKRKILVLEVMDRGICVETTPDMPFSIIDSSGNKIQDVYFLHTRVWNKGTDAIFRGDLSEQYPLTVWIEESARILGEPQIIKPNSMMTFEVSETSPNRFECTFDCLNPGEWVLIGFFVTGEPRAAIFTSGRVHGQNAQLQIKTDDSIAHWPERIESLFFVLIVALSPLALIGALTWLYESHKLTTFFVQNEKRPILLNLLLGWGTMFPLLYTMSFGINWLKRKRGPKGFPVPSDLPTYNTPLRVSLLTAIKGVRYVQSASFHDYGEIVPYSKSMIQKESLPKRK
jgi:hypothetical protein